MKQKLLFFALLWLGLIIFLSFQPRLVIEPSKELKNLKEIYQDRKIEIKGLDAVKENVSRVVVRVMPAVDSFQRFYGIRQTNLGDKFDFLVRKAGHWIVYFVLSLLIFGTLKQIPWKERGSPYAWTLSLGLIIAIADENHQTLMQGRSGAVQDVAVDAAGIIVALLLLWALGSRKILRKVISGKK